MVGGKVQARGQGRGDRHPDQSHEVRARTAEAEVERLRTVLATLISSSHLHPFSKALAMNTLEPGSGDAWLEKRTAESNSPGHVATNQEK